MQSLCHIIFTGAIITVLRAVFPFSSVQLKHGTEAGDIVWSRSYLSRVSTSSGFLKVVFTGFVGMHRSFQAVTQRIPGQVEHGQFQGLCQRIVLGEAISPNKEAPQDI